MTKTLKDHKDTLEYQLDYSRRQVERWQGDFAKDPAHALVWATPAFEHAAAAKVYQLVLGGADRLAEKADYDDAAVVAALLEYARDRMVEKAQNPPFSTSPTSNLMDQYEGKAWARVYRMFNGEAFF